MLSFQDLYETYAADVYTFSLWLSGDSFEAEDITSETFIRVWTQVKPIRTETLKAYTFTIARNIYLTQQRKRKRQVPLHDVYSDPSPNPEKIIEAQIEVMRVHRVLQSLPEIDRAAFVMRVQHELPCTEIARALGLSLSATKVKIHRVRKKMIADRIDKEVD